MALNMDYFGLLRGKINQQLQALTQAGKYSKDMAKKQIESFPWLYGALGKVPADVMFICENPSIAGINKAHVDTIDGGPPDIEAQWWGGYTDFAACRFRVALCQLNLKTTPPNQRDGWECYITNVIKQSNIAKDQGLQGSDKRQQARDWADILRWEIDHVKPKFVFCVGGSAFRYVQMLQREGLIQSFPIHEITHYSARNTTKSIIDGIINGVQGVMSITRVVPKDNISIEKQGNIQGAKMTDLMIELRKLDGQNCFTLTRDNPAKMHVDENWVTIVYPTGGTTKIPMAMLQEAWKKLQIKGILTLEDVHERITKRNGPRTDRLMAVFRNLSGVGFTREPRTLFLKK